MVRLFCSFFSGSLPSEPSSYVERAIIHILQPVIEGVTELPQAFQNSILVQAVEIMMDTWSSYILKEQIKFRFVNCKVVVRQSNRLQYWLRASIYFIKLIFKLAYHKQSYHELLKGLCKLW